VIVPGARGAVVVTGASTGIGHATALLLDREGFTVFAGVRRNEDGEAIRERSSRRLSALSLDVTKPDSIAAAASEVETATGGRLVGLVNNAGIAVAGPLEALPIEDFRNQIEVNLVGQVAVTQSLLRLLRPARGRIVFISSIGGLTASPFMAPYNASKFGIEAVGDSLRQELRGSGMHVSLVEPGAIATPIWAKGKDAALEGRKHYSADEEARYGRALDRLAELTEETAERGIAPERVAATVLEALTADRPRTRYLVGRDARIQAALQSLLPDRLRDRLVARFMGI
jgi:NAD(P)-dependent dehydrogenase (short-subunit alcohol dehydrogenase family)